MRKLPDPELTAEEETALLRIRDQDPRPQVRKRAQTLLLAQKKYQGRQISDIVGIHPNTITSILKRWQLSRLTSVTKKHSAGMAPRLTPEQLQSLDQWIFQDPAVYGYHQTTWTCKLLAAHLKKAYRVKLGPERVRQLLQQQHRSYKLPVLQPPTATSAQKKRPKLNF